MHAIQGPMQLLLEEHGNFHDKCGRDDEEEYGKVCEDQTAALLNVRLVSQLTVLLAPFIGLLSDRKGAQYVVFLMTALIAMGLLLLVFVASHDAGGAFDWLLYSAFICIGLAATCAGLLVVETGLMFAGKLRSRRATEDKDMYVAPNGERIHPVHVRRDFTRTRNPAA